MCTLPFQGVIPVLGPCPLLKGVACCEWLRHHIWDWQVVGLSPHTHSQTRNPLLLILQWWNLTLQTSLSGTLPSTKLPELVSPLYLCASVHRCFQCPLKGMGTGKPTKANVASKHACKLMSKHAHKLALKHACKHEMHLPQIQIYIYIYR